MSFMMSLVFHTECSFRARHPQAGDRLCRSVASRARLSGMTTGLDRINVATMLSRGRLTRHRCGNDVVLATSPSHRCWSAPRLGNISVTLMLVGASAVFSYDRSLQLKGTATRQR